MPQASIIDALLELAGRYRVGRKGLLILLAALFVPLMGAPSHAQQQVIERSFSEEDRPSTCRSGYVLKGVTCRGGYCDNKQLICERYIATYDSDASYRWSEWFSEERPNSQTGKGEFVSGIACSGRYCDNLKLRFIRSRHLPNPRSCQWTRPFSEEKGGRGQCPAGKFVAGVSCQGRYCDNLSLFCCNPR